MGVTAAALAGIWRSRHRGLLLCWLAVPLVLITGVEVVNATYYPRYLLFTMVGNGLRGFTQSEIRLDVDFPRSDLFLDPAALQGFGAQEALANADFGRVVAQAAAAQYGPTGARFFSDAARLQLRDDFRNLRFKDLFADLMESGHDLHVLYITGHWLDVDNLEDLNRAQTF